MRFHGLVLALALLPALRPAACPAASPPAREWRPGREPIRSSAPLFFRSSMETTWVRVGGACEDDDPGSSPHGNDQVWCFEGAGGDSTWPDAEGRGAGDWDHWSRFDPPIPPGSKWHVTDRHPGPTTGLRSAWLGCDSLGTNPSCGPVQEWVFRDGYGNNWDYPLTLDASGQDASAGGTIEFDLRYDVECNYDYLYLEFLDSGSATWNVVVDSAGTPAVFNGVSGILDVGHGGAGRPCGSDIYGHSDQWAPEVRAYGNSTWLTDVTFPIPPQPGGLQLRWRGVSDRYWSDEDGVFDTDGIGAIDNVEITFAATGAQVLDDFEDATSYNDFSSSLRTTMGPPASWIAGGLAGNAYDGWHLTFDPNYRNKGNQVEFSNDWMWASKPDVGPIPANRFSFFLASPRIECDGWTGGVLEYAGYLCAPAPNSDYTNTHVRVHRAGTGWSGWSDFDGFVTFSGCEFWNLNEREDLSPFLGSDVDSLQLGFEMLDSCRAGDFCWGRHVFSNWLIDRVSVGSFDLAATSFEIAGSDLFRDTFSRRDPAHTSHLDHGEEGRWPGRAFESHDSLRVRVLDPDGVTEGNVRILWRVGTGTPPAFGSWDSKAMNLTQREPGSASDEGIYSTTIGNGTTEDYGPSFEIWAVGTTVEYSIEVTDDTAEIRRFPDMPEAPPFRFRVLPMRRQLNAEGDRILVVDDSVRPELDFVRSANWSPEACDGAGAFADPNRDRPRRIVERSLALLYGGDPEDDRTPSDGGPRWDVYDVPGAGTAVQVEPRVIARPELGIGGIARADGTPYYDAVLWLNGPQENFTLLDGTRRALKKYLDRGGAFLVSGDDVAHELGGFNDGGDADSTIRFLQEYLGVEYIGTGIPVAQLNVVGTPGGPLDGVVAGLYSDCTAPRRYDQVIGSETPDELVVARFSPTGWPDATTSAVITHRPGDGATAYLAFGLEALISDESRACLLSALFSDPFGLAPGAWLGCAGSGGRRARGRDRAGLLALGAVPQSGGGPIIRFVLAPVLEARLARRVRRPGPPGPHPRGRRRGGGAAAGLLGRPHGRRIAGVGRDLLLPPDGGRAVGHEEGGQDPVAVIPCAA